jgi:LPS-assembly protein
LSLSNSSLLRPCAALLLLCCASARAETLSCPQLDFASELPPIPADPKLILNADSADLSEGGLSSLRGSVRISQDGREFAAEQVNYSEAEQRIRTDSQTLFRDSRYAIRSGRTDYDLKLGEGVFLDNRFTLRSIGGRGEADRIRITETGQARLDGVRFTTCAPGNEAWTLSASTIRFDEDTGRGSATNALLRFQHVPLFYLPWFQFPIDGLRHTGFLFPIVGNNENTGFDLRWPIYLNLGPNYDATLIPRYLSERGTQLGGQFRYLTRHHEGDVYGEFLPSDDRFANNSRSYVDFLHVGALSSQIGLEAKYGRVSDQNYFAIFGGGVDLTSTPFLERGARLTWQAPTTFRVEALVQDYQTLSQTQATAALGVPDPYRRLPQIRVDALSRGTLLDTRAGFFGEFTNFARSGSVEGQRVIAQPYLRWEQDHLAWYANAQGDLSYTAYNLTNVAPGAVDAPRRTLPQFSAEGGLRFERMTDGGNVQTLEPKLFYLYVPYRDQEDLPLFDSGLPDFDFPQLFARNRYSGYDRVSDANQLTTAVTSRFVESDSGIARLSATLGQIYYFRGPRVDLPGFDTPSEGSSNYLGNLDYALSTRWSAVATTEVSSKFDQVVRSSVALRYRDTGVGIGDGRRFDLAYRYRRTLLEQADASFSSPVTDHWRLAGRLRYSLRDASTLESFAGVEYQTCCWAVSGTYRRYLVGGVDNRFNNGFYLQLELRGLTKIGNGFERLLPSDDFASDKRAARGR